MRPKARVVKFYSTVSDRPEVVHLIARLFNTDGGPGSGNHGHAGRPGKVGGSAPGNGGSGRTVEEVKNLIKQKNNELDEASKHRDFVSEKRLIKEIKTLQDEKGMLETGLSEPDYRRKKAIEAYGLTDNFKEAAWMLPDGKMLDFDGAWDKSLGTRNIDHRDIAIIYPQKTGNGMEEVRRFRTEGNVRLLPEIPGINLSDEVEPTEDQYRMIRKMAEHFKDKKGQFYISLEQKDGNETKKLLYEVNPSDGETKEMDPDAIVNDIKEYYKAKNTGELQESETNKEPEKANVEAAVKSMTENLELARSRVSSESERWRQFGFFARYMDGIKYGEGAGHDAVYEYNFTGDVRMNNLLRGGTPRNYKQQVEWLSKEAETKKQIDDLTEAISKNRLVKPAVVFRGIETKTGVAKMLGLGVTGDELDAMLNDPEFAKSLIGHTFSDPAFTSTSIDPDVPRKGGFTKGAEMEIYCPEGTQGVYIGDQARITDEHEFLMQRGTQFVVTEAEVVENQFGVKRLKLQVAVVDQVPKEIPSSYNTPYRDGRPEIAKTYRKNKGDNIPKGFDNDKLKALFPNVPEQYIREINEIRESGGTERNRANWDRLHEMLQMLVFTGHADYVEAAEMYSYADAADRIDMQDDFAMYDKQINGNIEEAIKKGGSKLLYDVKEMYPNADESVVPFLMLYLSEARRLEESAKKDAELYGEGIITEGKRKTAKLYYDMLNDYSKLKVKR